MFLVVLRCYCGVLSSSKRLLKFWGVPWYSGMFWGVLIPSDSEMFLQVLCVSLVFRITDAFLGIVMGCMCCESPWTFWGVLMDLERYWRLPEGFYVTLDVVEFFEVFWCILISFDSFLKVLRRSLMYLVVLRRFYGFWIVLKGFWTFRSNLWHSEVIWGVDVGCERVLKVLRSSLMFWIILRHSETLLRILRCSERFLNVLRHLLTVWDILRRCHKFSAVIKSSW